MKFPQSLRDIDLKLHEKMISVVLKCLDDHEHFGGANTCDVRHALLESERYLDAVIPLDLTLAYLDELARRGRVEKLEGAVLTLWKVKDEGG